MPNPLPIAPQPRSPLDSRTIVSAGRIVPEKQFIHLLRAFEQVADEAPGWRLRILGDGPLREELLAHAAKAGLADRVELPGAVPDMAPEWARASVCAMSSRTEGFPLVAQEAMSAGVPGRDLRLPVRARASSSRTRSRGLLVGAGRQGRARRRAASGHLRRRPARPARRRARSTRRGSYDADAIAARWEAVFARVGSSVRGSP